MKVTYLTVFCLCLLTRYTPASSAANPNSTTTTTISTTPTTTSTTPSTSGNPGNPPNPNVNPKSSGGPPSKSKTQTTTTPTTTTPKPYSCSEFNCEGKGCSKNISATCVGTGKSCQITSVTSSNGTVKFDAGCVSTPCTDATTADTKKRCCNTDLCNQESLLTTQPSQGNGAIYWSPCTLVLVTTQAIASVLLK